MSDADQLRIQVIQLEGRFVHLEGRFIRLEERVGELTVETMRGRTEVVERIAAFATLADQRFAKMETRLATLESGLESLTTLVKDLPGELARMLVKP